MRQLFTLLVIILSNLSFAAEFHTIANGNFNNPTIWDLGSVPGSSDVIYIDHDITLAGNIVLNNGGITIAENQIFNVNDINVNTFSYILVYGILNATNFRTARSAAFYISENGFVHASRWDNFSTLFTNAIDGTIVIDNEFNNHTFGSIALGDGSITAGTFTGWGITFGWINNSIPDGSTIYSDGTLPIELISFDATTDNTVVNINWSTATEINNDYFTIERSIDGINFETVGTVLGAGTTNTIQEYSFVDENPVEGISYYRLTQTDFDGASETFMIIDVEVTNIASKSKLVSSEKSLIINSDNLPYSVNIYSIDGRNIYSEKNINSNTKHINLEKGFYIVNINNTTSEKVYIP